jgi:mono/diheme cytochrome c family protein
MTFRSESYKLIALGCLLAVLAGGAMLRAQSGSAAKPAASASDPNGAEFRGENLFLQRCALCHMVRKLKFGDPPISGPVLNGLFKTANPTKEKALRDLILKGTPRMPGYQYDLDSKEMDDLVSYMKTL